MSMKTQQFERSAKQNPKMYAWAKPYVAKLVV
jgi:hypothetical protein